MKKLFEYADKYLNYATWKDLALIKLCLFSAGTMIGLALPKKVHKPVVFIIVGVFVATYIPLMTKFIKIIKSN